MSSKTTRKRSTTSRRLRPGLDADQLVNVHRKLQHGDELGLGERRWIEGLLEDVMRDVDVRDRFYQTTRGAPSDQDRKFWCALWIAERVAGGKLVGDTQYEAETAWAMTEAQVKRAWLDHHAQAQDVWNTSTKQRGLSRLIELQRCNKSG